MNKITLKLWGQSIVCACALIVLSYGYYRLYNTASLSHSFAFAGLTLIILSHLLSGTSYFWGIGKSYLGYRKMLGVVGFATALGHAGINSFNTLQFAQGDFGRFFTIMLSPHLTYTPALLAILVMIGMVIISNWGMPRRLGATLWRQLLRLGYIAILLLIFHIGSVSIFQWKQWLETFSPILPPPSLVLVLLGVFSLVLRVSLFVALRRKKSQQLVQQAPQTPPQPSPNSQFSSTK